MFAGSGAAQLMHLAMILKVIEKDDPSALSDKTSVFRQVFEVSCFSMPSQNMALMRTSEPFCLVRSEHNYS